MIFFPDFSWTRLHMRVYGRSALKKEHSDVFLTLISLLKNSLLTPQQILYAK